MTVGVREKFYCLYKTLSMPFPQPSDQFSLTHTNYSTVQLIRDQINSRAAWCTFCMYLIWWNLLFPDNGWKSGYFLRAPTCVVPMRQFVSLMLAGCVYTQLFLYLIALWSAKDVQIPLFQQHRMGSSLVQGHDVEPFTEFWPKLNWFRTWEVGSLLKPKYSRFSLIWSANHGNTSGRVIFYKLERKEDSDLRLFFNATLNKI